jgi:hypothetical protein
VENPVRKLEGKGVVYTTSAADVVFFFWKREGGVLSRGEEEDEDLSSQGACFEVKVITAKKEYCVVIFVFCGACEKLHKVPRFVPCAAKRWRYHRAKGHRRRQRNLSCLL